MQNKRTTKSFSYTLLLIASLHFLVYTTFIPGNYQAFLLRECNNTKQVSVQEIERIQRPFDSSENQQPVHSEHSLGAAQAAAVASYWQSQKQLTASLTALLQHLSSLGSRRTRPPNWSKAHNFATGLAKGRRFASSTTLLFDAEADEDAAAATAATGLVILKA